MVIPYNSMDIPDLISESYFAIINSGFYAVDVFFWMSGFFVAVNFIK